MAATVSTSIDAGARRLAQRLRLTGAFVLCLLYALPLYVPPAPARPVPSPDATFLERVFPAVPPSWVPLRICALAVAGVLFAMEPLRFRARRWEPAAAPRWPRVRTVRILALLVAALHAASAPWAPGLGHAGQSLYLAAVVLPALVLLLSTLPSIVNPVSRQRVGAVLPFAALIIGWSVWRLATDVHSPRGVHPIDTWLAFLGMARYALHPFNFLTGDLHPDLPGVPASPLFFQGLPLFRSGWVPLGFDTMQVLDIGWMAVAAAALGAVASGLFGRPAALIAVAVFLFAPFDRFIVLDAGPYVVGPLYTTVLALAAFVACRRRSEAALALLGAVCGVALPYPSIVPTLALLSLATVWALRGNHRYLWVGWATATLSFIAAVAPNPPYVSSLGTMAGQHFELQGQFDLIEGVALGQLPVGHTVEQARTIVQRRPLDIVTGVALAPFASPRTSLRLWGDVIFEPVGTVLMVAGLAASMRTVGSSAIARFLLVLLVAAMAPAFVSNADRPNLMRALALPLPVALLAAAGFDALRRALKVPPGWRSALATVALIGCSGTWLFDVVNPRILSASSLGVMFASLDPGDADRSVVVDYPDDFSPDTRWLFTGPVATFGGPRPVGYVRYEPVLPDVMTEHKDLVFWSPGLQRDFDVTRAVCARWPNATMFDIADASGLAHLHAARITGRDWTPRGPANRWRRHGCTPGDGAGQPSGVPMLGRTAH